MKPKNLALTLAVLLSSNQLANASGQLGGLVDVAITGAFLEPDDLEISAGDSVTVEYSVYGTGGEAEDIPVGYFLSVDASFDSSDILLDTDEVDVEDGEIEDESEQVSIPNGTAPGCYHLLVVLDYTNLLSEPDESNNVGAAGFAVDASFGTCSGGSPNLTPAGAVLSAQAISLGDTVNSNVDVRNGGDAGSSNVELAWYLSTDSVYDGPGGDTLLDAAQIGSLPGGSEQALPRVLAPPVATVPGRYFVFFSVDPSDSVAESNESDNLRARRLVISDPAVSYYGFDAGGPNVGELTSIATPTLSTPFQLSVRGIQNGGSGVIFASFNRVSAPRFGGTILADLATTEVFQPFALTQGRVTLDVNLPSGMSGSTLYFQAAARDFTQTQNVALSNGVMVTLP